MRIAILGRTRILYNTTIKLRDNGHEIVLIGTSEASPEYDIKSGDFEELATDMGVDYFNDVHINSTKIQKKIKKCNADIAVSINWNTIISEKTMQLFPYGIINAHAGDLPRYRGNACPNWAILNGEDFIGITIHKMDKQLDTGDVVVKYKYKLKPDTTIREIYTHFENHVPDYFIEAIEKLQSGYKATSQIEYSLDPLRCYPRISNDSFIDWNLSAEKIDRLIRASVSPYAGAYTYLNLEKLIIWSCEVGVLSEESNYTPGQVLWIKDTIGVAVGTGNGVLIIKDIEFVNGDTGNASNMIKSIRTRLGMNYEKEISNLDKRLKELEKKRGD